MLSEREMSILRLLAQGLTNVQIGSALNISKHTVAQHVAAMLERTGSRTRAHLVAQAYEFGLLFRTASGPASR
jgi:DNA-binding CsgD family transcriptional regulator